MLTPAEEQLGRMALERGFLTRFQLDNAIEQMKVGLVPGSRRPDLDAYLVESGLITAAQARQLTRAVEGRGAEGSARRRRRASSVRQPRTSGGNPGLLIGGGVAGGLVVLLLLSFIIGGDDSPPKDDPPPTSSSSGTATTPAGPRQANPLDEAIARTKEAVQTALESDDTQAASDAISAFRIQLVGAPDAQSYAAAASQLEQLVDDHRTAQRAGYRRRFTELMDGEKQADARAFVDALKSRDDPDLAALIGEMEAELLSARMARMPELEKPPTDRPEDKTPDPPVQPPPTQDRFVVADFSDGLGTVSSHGIRADRLSFEGGKFGLRSTVTVGAGKVWALRFDRTPKSVSRFKTLRFCMRAVGGFRGLLWVRLDNADQARSLGKIFLTIDDQWKQIELPLNQMTRARGGFDPNGVTSLSFAGQGHSGAGLQLELALIELDTKPPGTRKSEIPRIKATTDPDPDPDPSKTDPEPPKADDPDGREPGIKITRRRPIDPNTPDAILVRNNGVTYVGKIYKRADGGYEPPGLDYYIPAKRIARYVRGTDLAAELKTWGNELSDGRGATPKQWMTLAKYVMFNRLDRKWVRVAMGQWKKAKLEHDNERWEVLMSRHFVLCSDLRESRRREYSTILEAALRHYRKTLKSTVKPGLDFVVRIYSERKDYIRETGSTGSLGVYMPMRRELAVWNAENRADTIAAVFHEAAHQYMHEYYRAGYSTKVHWFEEGIAEYFETAKLRSGAVTNVGKVHRRHQALLKVLARDFKLNLKALWTLSYTQFYSDQLSTKYALSWVLVHFFMNTREPKYKKAWQRWLDKMAKMNRQTIGRLFDLTLGRLDLEQLEKDVTAYIKKL